MIENDNIFVSVIVASYNYGRYLKENLESLHNQTYKNFEVIIVDDGSTDNSLEIINEYIEKDSRFRLIIHENHSNIGLRKSLIKAIADAKGEYIAFCESDDYWDVNYLLEKVSYINKYPQADVVISDMNVFGPNKKSVKHYTQSEGRIALFNVLKKSTPPRNIFYQMCFTWTFPTFSIVMVRSSSLRACSFELPTVNGIDTHLWKQLSLNCKIGYVDKKLTYYRRHGEGLVGEENLSSSEYAKILDKVLNLSKFQKFKIKLIKRKRKLFSIFNCEYYTIIRILGMRFCFNKKIN